MPITLPSYVAPNELIQSAWGNAVVNALDELDDEKLNLTGGTLTGGLTGTNFVATGSVDIAGTLDVGAQLTGDIAVFTGAVNGITPTSAPHLTRKDYVDAGDDARVAVAGDNMTGQLVINSGATNGAIALRNTANNPLVDFQTTVGVRHAYVRGDATGLELFSVGDITFAPDSVVRARMLSSNFLLGKTASNLATTGLEMHMTSATAVGSIRSTIDAAGIQNLYCRHVGSADANGEDFVQFVAGGAVRGSVSQVSTTGVAFNTTSDERLKTVLRDLDDDEIATILRLLAPVVFEFNEAPGVEHVGFIAQHLAAMWPVFVDVGIVTPGRGEPGDPDVLDDEGNVVRHGFEPWKVDLSKFTPLLVAGWQALDRRLTAVENTI